MHLRLFELLQSNTSSGAAAKIVAFAQNNDAKDLQCVILQFFAHFTNRNYSLTTAELDRNEIDQMALDIYESEPYGDTFETTSTIKDFFSYLLDRGYQSGVACSLLETAWINFLSMLATHEDIPNNCAFKAKALELLSLLINPLAQNVKVPGRGNEDLLKSLQEAIKLVATGFAFVAQSSCIASEFIEAMESHPEVFIIGCTENLGLYKKLLLQENTALHIAALKSLRNLCNNQDIHTALEEFFFEESEDDETFRMIFDELVTRRSLKLHIIPLVKAINNLPSERSILSDEIRDQLYLNVFDQNRKIVTETAELMIALGEDVWLQVVRLLNAYEEGQRDIATLVQNLSKSDEVDSSVAHMLKLLLENLPNPKTAQRLASILVAQMKQKTDEHDTILRTLEHLLERCTVDELTFTIILELVVIISPDTMSEYYKLNMSKFTALSSCLTKAYSKFETNVTLYNIISTLAKLSSLLPKHMLDDMRTLFNCHYSRFLFIHYRTNMDVQRANDYVEPMTKLSNILEFRGWNLLTETYYTTLNPIIQQLCSEMPDEVSRVAIRLYANFLKQIWARFVVNKPVPLRSSGLANDIDDVIKGLYDVVENKPMELNEGFFIVRSLLDILVMFQPNMKQRYGHKMFKKVSIELPKERVKLLGAYVAKVVYGIEKSESQDEVHKREMILLSWIAFCKNYVNLPSLTASEKIIAHYRYDDPFKGHMEMLLEHLMTQKTSLEQTVSIVAYQFSNNVDRVGFQAFFSAFDGFITRSVEDVAKRSAIKLAIGTSILNKLPAHIVNLRDRNDENRLDVLDFVKIIVKSVDPALKMKLVDEVPEELNTIGLTDEEQTYLDEFKHSLRS